MLALPPPSAGPPPPPPAATQPGTRPPFIPSTGVGSVPAMGIGRGVVNGSSNVRPTNVANSVANQPSITDIAAGALLIASVVQGQLCRLYQLLNVSRYMLAVGIVILSFCLSIRLSH